MVWTPVSLPGATVVVPVVVTVKLRKVQVPALELAAGIPGGGKFICLPAEAAGRLTVQPVPRGTSTSGVPPSFIPAR